MYIYTVIETANACLILCSNENDPLKITLDLVTGRYFC